MDYFYDPWLLHLEKSQPILGGLAAYFNPSNDFLITLDDDKNIYHAVPEPSKQHLKFSILNCKPTNLIMAIGKSLNFSLFQEDHYFAMKVKLLAIRGPYLLVEKPQIAFSFPMLKPKPVKKTSAASSDAAQAAAEAAVASLKGKVKKAKQKTNQDEEFLSSKIKSELKRMDEENKKKELDDFEFDRFAYDALKDPESICSILNFFDNIDFNLSPEKNKDKKLTLTQKTDLLKGFDKIHPGFIYLPKTHRFYPISLKPKLTVPKIFSPYLLILNDEIQKQSKLNLFFNIKGSIFGSKLTLKTNLVNLSDNSLEFEFMDDVFKFQRRDFLRVDIQDPNKLTSTLSDEKEQEIHEAFLLDLGLGGAGIVLPKVTDQNSLDISVKKMKLKVSMGEEVNLEIPCKMASIKETKSGVRLGLKFDDHLQFNTTKTLQEFVFSLQRKQLKAMQN